MTSATPRLRVGFLSAVRHMQPYAAVLRTDPRVELVGVAEEPSAPEWMQADSRAAADAVGVPFTLDITTLLDPSRVDAVVVCAEPTRHARLASMALAAGVHVLVDKPLATSLSDVDALVDHASRATGTLAVVNRLGSPALQRVRGWVDAGHLGLPLHVDAEWLASGAHFATSVERPELVVDPSLSGGGEVLNFMLYPVDAVLELTGLDVLDVHCEASTLFGAAHRATGVEDCAVASLRLERGVTATITVGRVPAAPGLGAVSSTVRVLGSHGNAEADDDRPQLRRYTTDGGLAAEPVGGPSSDSVIRSVLGRWVEDLVSGRRPAYGAERARAALAVVDAALRSIATGQPAAVTPPPGRGATGPEERVIEARPSEGLAATDPGPARSGRTDTTTTEPTRTHPPTTDPAPSTAPEDSR